MAYKSKVEKMVEFVPNNLDMAQEAYNELNTVMTHVDILWLANWMHKSSSETKSWGDNRSNSTKDRCK